MSKELKPCPFCGGKASIITDDRDSKTPMFAAMCNNCYMQSSWCHAQKEVGIWWNRRADDGTDQ